MPETVPHFLKLTHPSPPPVQQPDEYEPLCFAGLKIYISRHHYGALAGKWHLYATPGAYRKTFAETARALAADLAAAADGLRQLADQAELEGAKDE